MFRFSQIDCRSRKWRHCCAASQSLDCGTVPNVCSVQIVAWCNTATSDAHRGELEVVMASDQIKVGMLVVIWGTVIVVKGNNPGL
jgi:hypothetical protein